MTCRTVIGGENIWKEQAAASWFCKTADVPKSKVNSFFRDFFKFVCANSLYRGGPKTLLTDLHLLRSNLFFVTETSELSLAGLCFQPFSSSTSPLIMASSTGHNQLHSFLRRIQLLKTCYHFIAVTMDQKKCGMFSSFRWLSPAIYRYHINILRHPNELDVHWGRSAKPK